MREILFRGKSICADSPSDVNHNYWIEGSLVHQTEHCEVLGNIHDNPELLEVTEND